ncbi:MAG TPA: von Willebrand factor type A domain-containing protein [Verrucomicrobiae bacterium]
MNPESLTDPRQALEVSLTALVLGELPADQAEFLRRAIAQDSELARMHERLRQTIDLVRETEKAPHQEPTATPEPLKLSEDRRQELLQQFKTVAPREFAEAPSRQFNWLIPAGIAALLLVFVGGALLPALSRGKAKSRGMSALSAPSAATEQLFARDEANRLSLGLPLERVRSAPAIAPPTAKVAVQPPKTTIVLPISAGETKSAETVAANNYYGGFAVQATPPVQLESHAVTPDSSTTLFDSVSAAKSVGAAVNYSTVRGEPAQAQSVITSSDRGRPLDQAAGTLTVPRVNVAGGGGMGGGGGLGGGKPGSELATGYRRFYDDGRAQNAPAPPAQTVDAGAMRMRYGLAGRADTAGASGVEKFYRLQTVNGSQEATAPATGLPASAGKQVASVDPATGLPLAGGVGAKAEEGRTAGDAVIRAPAIPVLGDVPAIGQLFRNEGVTPSSRGQVATATDEEKAAEAQTAGRIIAFVPQAQAQPPAGKEAPGKPASAYKSAGVSRSTNQAYYARNLKANSDRGLTGGDYDNDGLVDLFAGNTDSSRGKQPSSVTLPGISTVTNFGYALPQEELNSLGLKLNDAAKGAALAELRKKREAEVLLSSSSSQKKVPPALHMTAPDSLKLGEEKQRLVQIIEQPAKDGDSPQPKPATPPPIPQPEVQSADNSFSTFSLNVSDVSFKMAAVSLEQGVLPEPGSIRSEEFINAFDYRDPEPAPGMPVGFCWDRARYPFAQNRDVLRFSVKTAARGRQSGQPLNLVLLLDNSGSMERADRVRIIREALKVLAAQLQPQDKLSVVTFARTAQLRVDGVAGNQAAEPLEEIGGLTPEGGTNLEEAMNLAYQTALKHYLASGINRVVLLTDGAANLGDVSPENLKKKVEDHRKQGIAFDCFGIGWEGYNDDLLEVLSRNGDGRYGFINTPEEASTEFAAQLGGALHVAASDVKVQVEFNPKRVAAWRQIGYAKHQLTKEQFRDNTVDAAEIGAAESGNALYVIEVNPRGEGALATVRVRYKIPGTAEYHEHEWAVPFNGSAAPLEQSSPAMRLVASASALSEWLAQNPYATEVTPDALLQYVSGVPEVYGADPRPKKLEWMIRQAKSLAGK